MLPDFSLQTKTAPLQSLKLIEDFVASQKSQNDWISAVIVANSDNLVILLVDQSFQVVQALRIVLDNKDEIIAALKLLNPLNKSKIGSILTAGSEFDITSLASLQKAYDQNREKVLLKTYKQAYTYFDHKSGGRGEPISKPTAQGVVFEAKGLCMYEGCGQNLLQDSLTGVEANFHYLAHIIASSPDGPRGGNDSKRLSNVASNIMLLCDKHHRLIDKIAVQEHTVERLRAMRAAHLDKAKILLKGMAYTPVPIFTAIYPVGNWVPTLPTSQEVAVTLHPLHSCSNGIVTALLEKSSIEQATDEDWYYSVPRDLRHIHNTLQGTKDYEQVKSGIYAIAPGAILVALGAIIGNKNGLVAVPRYRDGGWSWLSDKSPATPFSISESESLDGYRDDNGRIPEVAVSIYFTDTPTEVQSAVEILRQRSNIPLVSIVSSQSDPKCIATPRDCEKLRQIMHELLHRLRNHYSTSRVHLFHCANNAALVEVGRGIEHFHPSVRVYEHTSERDEKLVLPRLDITPGDNQVSIIGTPLEDVNSFRQSFFGHQNKEALAHA